MVTLYIDDSSIRLLVARGKQVEKGADLPLKSGLVKDGVVLNEAEVAARIKELLQAQGVKAREVIVGLSGLHCLSRQITLPKLPKAMLAEAVRREAERELPVPLEQLYLSWQIISRRGEEVLVFLVALPRNTADALIKTVHRAGIEPYIMDLKPLALARVVNEATAIIVDVQPTEFDIVVMANRVPQLIRTLPLPSESSWPKKLATVREELDRTIKFYDSSHSENPLDPSTPIFVFGELAQQVKACQSLASELKRSVLPPSLPLECPEGLALSHYMVNIGLARKEISQFGKPGKQINSSIVNLNVLPDVYRPKARPLTEILTIPSIIVAIGLLVFWAIFVQNTATDTASLRTQLDTTNQLVEQKLAQQQSQKAIIAELEQKIAEVEASRDTFTAVLDNFARQQEIVNGDLAVATSTLPNPIVLSSIAHTSEVMTISGTAPSEEEVFEYARNLRASGRFSQVIISTMEKTEGENGEETEGESGEKTEEELEEMSFTLTLWGGG